MEFQSALKQSETLLLLCVDICQLHLWDSPTPENSKKVAQFKNQFFELKKHYSILEQQLSTAELQLQRPTSELKKLENQLILIQSNIQQISDVLVDTPLAKNSSHSRVDFQEPTSLLNDTSITQKIPSSVKGYANSSLSPTDSDPLTNVEAKIYLQEQELLIQDHDFRLDELTQVVQRQKGMAIDMGQELDTQVDLIERMDMNLDRTGIRLDNTNTRLNNVSQNLKAASHWWIILGLLLLLLLLLYL
ncbi:hypothetical protein HMI55_006546 [Coelomomyces lativittatus]|nr:hypothetical protein HMI55_006546 [Coelomomyces lativittatus]